MSQDNSKFDVKFDAVEKRIANAFLTLRQSDSTYDKRLAQEILMENPRRANIVRIEAFIELFCSMLCAATTEQLYPGDQPLTVDDVAYQILREVLWRLADETNVEAAQETAEGALEVVELTFGHREAGQNRISDTDL